MPDESRSAIVRYIASPYKKHGKANLDLVVKLAAIVPPDAGVEPFLAAAMTASQAAWLIK